MRNIDVDIVKKEHEIESVNDRIRDLEWKIDKGEKVDLDARTKALDKIRHLKKEQTELKIKRLCKR